MTKQTKLLSKLDYQEDWRDSRSARKGLERVHTNSSKIADRERELHVE